MVARLNARHPGFEAGETPMSSMAGLLGLKAYHLLEGDFRKNEYPRVLVVSLGGRDERRSPSLPQKVVVRIGGAANVDTP